jgi:hypothetical protein
MANDGFLIAFLVAAGVLVVFLILREFWTWYWKQSQQLSQLKRIADSLERLEARTGRTAPTAPGAPDTRDWMDRMLDRVSGVA